MSFSADSSQFCHFVMRWCVIGHVAIQGLETNQFEPQTCIFYLLASKSSVCVLYVIKLKLKMKHGVYCQPQTSHIRSGGRVFGWVVIAH